MYADIDLMEHSAINNSKATIVSLEAEKAVKWINRRSQLTSLCVFVFRESFCDGKKLKRGVLPDLFLDCVTCSVNKNMYLFFSGSDS